MIINIIEYFEKTAAAFPEKIAAIDGDRVISFGELEKRSRVLASVIAEKSDLINKPIAVFLPKSIECIICDISITYSGNSYMNLDVKSPLNRIKNILDLIKPIVILSDFLGAAKLKEAGYNDLIINIEDCNFAVESEKQVLTERLKKIIDTDPLCIINTSGSTGTPKGVVLNHKSFIDFTEWAVETLSISENEIVGSLSPAVFDIFSFELCMLMAKGSTIVIIPESWTPFPVKILHLMQERKITFIFWVPTIMVNIAKMDLLTKISLPDLKTVWFAGEVFPTRQFNYWRRNLPVSKFVNLYGPIEITLDCTYYIVDRELSDNEPIPIGFPCRNTDIIILNDENKPVDVNEDGEIYVRGTSLAMGYYNNPEKTRAAFVQNPLNSSYPELIYRTGDIAFINERGEIIFKGRKDTLIKHMGYRIELGEIEHVIINTLKLVENGCVVYNSNEKKIIFFYESKIDTSKADLIKQMAEVLPKYMIPNTFILVQELPRNTNGKIDRLKLQEQSIQIITN